MDKKIYIGASYYPEHWHRERWAEDIRLMKESGIMVLRLAELAWSFLEPTEGRFDFEWLDDFIALAYKEGIEVILGTPIEASPVWLRKKHPDVVAKDEFGHIHADRGRHCHNNKDFIQYVSRIVEEMAGHYASNPAVIGWQIDNELRAVDCYCDECKEAFINWLRECYGTIQELNEAWGTCFWSQVYNSWDEVEIPSGDKLTRSVSQILDFKRFASYSTVEHLNRQVEIIKKHAPHHFVTHNTLGLYPALNMFELSKNLDFASWDSYPAVDSDNNHTCMGHDLHRGIKRDNFWVMEQKNGFFNYSDYNLAIEPGLVKLWAWQDIARGANGVMFYRWRANRYGAEQNPNGILLHDGTPRRAFYEIKELTDTLHKYGNELAETKAKADVAIIYSYDQMWSLESKKQYPNVQYHRMIGSYYKAVIKMGLTADLVDPASDLSRYRLVIAPGMVMVNEEIASNFGQYVEQGGNLVLTVMSGIKSWSNTMVDIPWPGLFADLAGIGVEEFEVIPDRLNNTISYHGKEYKVNGWLDILTSKSASSIAVYTGKFYAGKTAITRNKFGKGTVTYIGVMNNDDLVQDILVDLYKEQNYKLTMQPNNLYVTQRVNENIKYTFVVNMSYEPAQITIEEPGTDIQSGAFVSGEVSVKGRDILIVRSDR